MDPLPLALEWASRGFPVFPVMLSIDDTGHLVKRPGCEHGFRAASCDPVEVAALFASCIAFPGQHKVCGVVPGPAGFVIIDCDIKGGGDGRQVADAQGIPGSVVVTTPSGGEHRVFRKPSARLIGNASPWPYIDVRADAGFVIAPGTETPLGSWVCHTSWDEAEPMPDGPFGMLSDAVDAGHLDLPTEVADETKIMVDHLISQGATVDSIHGGSVWVRRPGASHTSGTVGAMGPGVFYNFSSTWHFPVCVALVMHEGRIMTTQAKRDEQAARWVADAQPRSSWTVIPHLDEVMRSEGRAILPAFCMRVDGPTLFYPGKLNVLFGQSEAGKSWLALECIRQVVEAGGRAAYADLEDSPETFRDRMRTIGCDVVTHVEAGRLGYIQPTGPMDPAAVEGWDVLVIDSANELLTLNTDSSINDNGFVTAQYRLLRHVAYTYNVAIILIDHATNKADAGTAIGASGKKNAVDGSEVLVVNEVPLKGGQGLSHIYITKDRPGGIDGVDHRTTGAPHKRRAWAAMSLQLDITPMGTLGIRVSLEEPRPEQRAERADKEHTDSLVISCLETHAGRLKVLQIAAQMDCAHSVVSKAITRLEMADRVHKEASDDARSPWIVLGPKAPEGWAEV